LFTCSGKFQEHVSLFDIHESCGVFRNYYKF
jgi:hypothetical protein